MKLLDAELMALNLKPLAEVFGIVPEDEVRELELQLGCSLPEDYRWFLRNYGTSLFEFAVSSPTLDGSGIWQFGYFYGSEASDAGVLSTYLDYEADFPAELVPIADDGMGNLFFLAAFGPNRGCIYYWGHDDGCETYVEEGGNAPYSTDYPGMQQMATSFTGFVSSLKLDDIIDE